MATVRIDSIPEEMKQADRWLVWKLSPEGAKVPRSALTGHACNPTDSANFATFEQACATLASGDYDGLGFALGGDWAGVDQDDCYDPQTGLTPTAAAIVAELDSYTEISPSGTGVKTFVKFTGSVGEARPGLELYAEKRYFTVTGNHLPGTPTTVDFRGEAYVALMNREFPPAAPAAPSAPTSLPERIDQGGRDNLLFREGCRLRERGAEEPEIYAFLSAVNAHRCNPPLPDDQIRQKAQNACRFKPGTGMDPVGPRFAIHNRETLISRPAAPFLVKDLLVKGSLIALVADPNVGKTFITTSLTLAIASGADSWLGRPLRGSGPVVYVIAEGVGRFSYRILAWEQVNGRQATNFFWIDEPVALLDQKTADAFVTEVAALNPVLVVIDTLSRCLMGGNENSQEDMGKAVAVCDDLRKRAECAVIVVHHTRKDGSVERGSTVLRGAADTLILVKEETRGILTLSCEKQKDADAFEPIKLIRRAIELDGVSDPETGDPASSCVIELADSTDLDRAAGSLRRRICDLLKGSPGITKRALEKEIEGRGTVIRETLREMIASGEIRMSKGERNADVLTLGEPELKF